VKPVDKALWYIESHSNAALSLEEIAANANVSKYYLLRAFSAATGLSIMRYLRGRRLSVAAQRLAAGADDILSVAVECGYGSHEAFTRAFRDCFGITPEALRAQGHMRNIKLVEAILMGHSQVAIESPTFKQSPVLLIAGINQRYEGLESAAGIPSQWQRFNQFSGSIPRQVNSTAYGVCYNTDDEGSMDYLCGVQVRDFAALPKEFTSLRLPEQRYAVFFHSQHISAIRGTWNTIWNEWLPQSGHHVVDAPIIELYDQRFDPKTGNGGVELWVPLG
jgi:AraC family transcriptional regulator